MIGPLPPPSPGRRRWAGLFNPRSTKDRRMKDSSTAEVFPARWVPTLYFAEGLPFVAIAMVSTLMYKNMGVSDAQIAFWTSLVMLPWTLKPVWGPLLEMFKTKKHFVVGTQFLGGISFGLLALTLPLDGFFKY